VISVNKAVFLDRDGTINEIVYFPELGIIDSPLNPEQFKLLSKVADGIRILNGLGLKVIIVSNQPAIAKGKTTMSLFEKIRSKMKNELEKNGSYIDGEYYCFHHPEAKLIEYRENCNCRKPKPGLLLKASEDFDIDLSHSYLIGDSLMDIEAGKAAGCMTFLIGKEKCDLCKFMEEKKIIPDHIVPDLFSASRIIENSVNNE
jgi:D-glycero-D-manno-heptose 1,7-bisphosphate phosphatase